MHSYPIGQPSFAGDRTGPTRLLIEFKTVDVVSFLVNADVDGFGYL